MPVAWRYASSVGKRPWAGSPAALAASILLHVLGAMGLWWLPRGAVHPLAPVFDVAIDVTWVEPAARKKEAARAEDGQPAPVPERDRRRGPPRRARGEDGSIRESDSSAALSESVHADGDSQRRSADLPPPTHGVVTDGALSAEIPRAHDVREDAENPRAPHSVDLSFEGLAGDAKLRALPSARSDPLLYPSLTSTRRRRSIDDLTSETVRQTDAEENVQRGRAHPLLFEYMRAARTCLEPEATLLAEALPLGPSLSMQGWGRGYLGRVEETGRKATGREPLDSTIRDPIGGAQRPDLFPAYNEATRQASAGAEQRTAEICLGVTPDRPVVVTLRRSSGHAALDQLAVDSFQKAALTRPMAADVRPGLACYQVRITAFRMPPLPMLSFGIKNRKLDVIYPLKRLTKVTVDLVSVDHGDSGKPRSLLRAR
jgi:hypothetical protein